MTRSPAELRRPLSRFTRHAGGLLLTLLVSLPLVSHAEIYKCRLPGGKTEISNMPCTSPAGMLSVRPDESVPEASREQVARDVARMRNFVEKREAAQRAEDEAEQQRQADAREAYARQRVYQSAYLADCLAELEQQAIDSRRRAELEAICRAKPRVDTPPPTPVVIVPAYVSPPPANGVALCIQNVMRLRLAPAEQNRRIDLCQGQPVLTPPASPPATLPVQPPNTPQRPCPRGDKYCVR